MKNKFLVLAFILQPLAFSPLFADPPATTQPPISSITSASVLFVAANGNDSEAVVGDPTRPWATWQAAYISGTTYSAAHGNCRVLLKGGIISGAGITLTANWNANVLVAGLGPQLTSIGGISGAGTPGVAGLDIIYQNNGGNAGNGADISLVSDGSVNVGAVVVDGGVGGAGYNDVSIPGVVEGGNGGNAGTITLTNVYFAGTSAKGGQGGTGGWAEDGAGNDGNGGNGGTIVLTDCKSASASVDASGGSSGNTVYGNGGSAGIINITRSLVGSVSANGAYGYYGGTNGNDGTATLFETIFQSVQFAQGNGTASDLCGDGQTVANGTPFCGAGSSASGALTTNHIQP